MVDRMIIFDIKGRNEIGDTSNKQLIVEIMGRHSNIILVDKTRNMILDSIKHVSFAVNSYRAVLPGQEYILPPEQHKANPFEADDRMFCAGLILMLESWINRSSVNMLVFLRYLQRKLFFRQA